MTTPRTYSPHREACQFASDLSAPFRASVATEEYVYLQYGYARHLRSRIPRSVSPLGRCLVPSAAQEVEYFELGSREFYRLPIDGRFPLSEVDRSRIKLHSIPGFCFRVCEWRFPRELAIHEG